MRSFVFYSMVVLMIVWTAFFIMELAYVYFSSPAVATVAASEFAMADIGQFYVTIRTEFWGIASGARVAVWALPMLVFAILSAATQPAGR